MVDLLERLEAWHGFRAVVVGDLMLDELVSGDASRLSPDAPVPVLRVTDRQSRPGGASNVAMELAALGGEVAVVGVTGQDQAAKKLGGLLGSHGIETGGIVLDPTRPTTVKQNLIGYAQGRHPQKMFRVDTESLEPVNEATAERLITGMRPLLASCDVAIIEDYGKGVCTPALLDHVFGMCREFGLRVIVDPAAISDYARYRGATAILPNRAEAELATGLRTGASADADHSRDLARRLLDAVGVEAVILTLDRHGALLMERSAAGHQAVALPTVAREVYDVTGAGDVMTAGVAAAIANGWSWVDAVRLANVAAGLEVQQMGVVPIPLERIRAELVARRGCETPRGDGSSRGGRSALLTPGEAAALARSARDAGRAVVFTNGCFDVLHAGHVTLLDRARELGDLLIVGLNTDASVSRLKGPTRPINPERDRVRVLAALAAVDAVVLFGSDQDGDTPLALLEAIRPDVLVKGGDYSPEQVVGAELVASYGGRIELVPAVAGRSTTRTIDRIRSSAATPEAAR